MAKVQSLSSGAAGGFPSRADCGMGRICSIGKMSSFDKRDSHSRDLKTTEGYAGDGILDRAILFTASPANARIWQAVSPYKVHSY